MCSWPVDTSRNGKWEWRQHAMCTWPVDASRNGKWEWRQHAMCTWPVDASRKGNGSGGSTRYALGLLMLAERGT